jgi:hypothetical protein
VTAIQNFHACSTPTRNEISRSQIRIAFRPACSRRLRCPRPCPSSKVIPDPRLAGWHQRISASSLRAPNPAAQFKCNFRQPAEHRQLSKYPRTPDQRRSLAQLSAHCRRSVLGNRQLSAYELSGAEKAGHDTTASQGTGAPSNWKRSGAQQARLSKATSAFISLLSDRTESALSRTTLAALSLGCVML